MSTYSVRISIPTYYEVEAADPQEARTIAERRFQAEHPSWRTPESEVIELTGEVSPRL